MMASLERQTAIVTGGAAGIGAACVHKLVDEGAHVLLIDKDEEALSIAKDTFAAKGSMVMFGRLDVAREEDRQSAVERAIEWRGSCDILVNNAASFIMRGVDAAPEEWQEVFEVNVVACARLAHWMASNTSVDRADRSIVNICSISATLAQSGFATYNASKGALLTLTKCLALDLAPIGIRVNAVSPGTIWTDSNAGHIKRRYGLDRCGADAHSELGSKHVLRRLGDPSEVANAVAFLASSEASFITGANLFVDGGYSIV